MLNELRDLYAWKGVFFLFFWLFSGACVPAIDILISPSSK